MWDSSLQESLSGGRAVTFAELYDRYFDFVWRVVRGSGVHPTQIEDAVQDVFVVVHRRLSDFRPNASHKTWLFAIAVRVAKDYRRQVARKGGLIPLEETIPAPGADPFDAAVKAQAVRIVDAYLETLDEPKRNVFILAEIAQMTVPEIAAVLEVNLNTVYSRLRAARSEFSAAVERWYGPGSGSSDG